MEQCYLSGFRSIAQRRGFKWSINAVKTQIWTAVCTYMILIIIHKTYDFSVNLRTMMQVLSVSLLERMTFKELFLNPKLTEPIESDPNQLGLFYF